LTIHPKVHQKLKTGNGNALKAQDENLSTIAFFPDTRSRGNLPMKPSLSHAPALAAPVDPRGAIAHIPLPSSNPPGKTNWHYFSRFLYNL